FRDGRQTGHFVVPEFRIGPFGLPSADGRLVFIPRALVARDGTTTKIPGFDTAYLVPAHEPGFFVALGGAKWLPESQGEAASRFAPTELVVYTENRDRLFAVSGLDELKPEGSLLSWDKRVHYYPTGGLLVTAAPDRLVLRRVELAARLAKSEADYPFAVAPPPGARAGQSLAFRLPAPP